MVALVASACSSTKPASSSSAQNNSPKQSGSIQFLNNVSIHPESHYDETGSAKPSSASSYYHYNFSNPSGIENYSPLQFKYAILLDAAVEEMSNQRLLAFMEEWYGAKYHFGGTAKDGIDCSAFVSTLMSDVYGVNNLPRMSKDQYEACRKIKRDDLQEGDLVFFHTYGKRRTVTHVGVYLRNNKFVHASVSGVMISSMEDGYYASHFVGAARALNTSFKDAAAN
ncbi:MAG: C40 family peptidase [Bacteroidetes bacterium]|nr:C40 family peptidase [Bacteroidota bacterium]